ncbi:MAG TPA: hypothetical protein VLI45_03180 [Acidobacteriaceae bacterium]|nr:hypothetical protein [Acidobacteriaceae bacterium]
MPMISRSSPFPRRENADGSVDSICPNCYRTAASGRRSELDDLERAHVCDPQDLLTMVWVGKSPENGVGMASQQKPAR